ncbi:XRE family transcriptional regulator [Verrucomicrobium sp. 3C]|uniref:helix-turn-helix domain-containing protein n=1 Tax=Verrucomicrobium sp. 3C TaxID=1134055 RepID=UPI00036A4B86|nr:XRE family transcriptional regulator [Verrucomicrobium sp. 3C]
MLTKVELGQRLRRSRESAGLSQKEAAAELGLPRPAISQIEAGKRGVDALELMRLAQLYGKPASWFLELGTGANPLDDVTNLETFSKADQDMLSGFVRFCEAYGWIEALLELSPASPLPDYGTPVDPEGEGEAIRQGEAVAEAERRRLGLGGICGEGVESLLDRLGIRLSTRYLPTCPVRGAFLFHPRVGAAIFGNSGCRGEWLPLILAEEFGHLLFDRRLGGAIHGVFPEKGNPPQDLRSIRAHRFAFAFVLPAPELRRILLFDPEARIEAGHRLGVPDLLLSRWMFRCPAEVLWERWEQLGWVRPGQRERLGSVPPADWSRRYEGRGRKEGKVEHPYPGRFLRLVLEGCKKGQVSREQLGTLLGLDRIEAGRLMSWLDKCARSDLC